MFPHLKNNDLHCQSHSQREFKILLIFYIVSELVSHKPSKLTIKDTDREA